MPLPLLVAAAVLSLALCIALVRSAKHAGGPPSHVAVYAKLLFAKIEAACAWILKLATPTMAFAAPKPRTRRAISNTVVGVAMIFIVVAFLALVLGITYGLIGTLTQNANITISQTWQNVISQSEGFAGLGLQVLLMVGIISALMLLLGVFGIRLGGER